MFTMVGQAIPSFWLALILMIVLGLNLGILPISGTGTWQHFVMPGIVLAFTAIPALTRLTRSGMIEAMASDYIRTARAKGLSRATIMFKHALRNAAMPVVSIAAVQLGFMLGGSIVIETVFALHGVGYLGWESIAKNDFPDRAGGGAGARRRSISASRSFRHPQCAARSEAARPDERTDCNRSAADVAGRHGRLHGRDRHRRHHRGGGDRSAISSCRMIRSRQDLGNRLKPPFWMEGTQAGHLLGTDQLGRDYLARLVYGARISLLIGIMTVITSGLIGITLGVLGGFFGGRVDDAVLFVITTRLSIPVVLVALAVVGLMGRSSASWSRRSGLLLWDRFAVVARATTMQIRSLDYVNAARCAGASTLASAAGDAAEHREPSRRGRNAGDGARDPARGGAVVPRPRRAAAAAVLGADDRRGQGLHVLLGPG